MAGGRLCPVGNKYSLRQPSTGLRATFVPSKDDMSSASDPDHLVLKDPVVLTDKTTGEQVGIAQHMPLLHGQKKANIHMQERKNYLLFKLSTALDRMLPPLQKSSKQTNESRTPIFDYSISPRLTLSYALNLVIVFLLSIHSQHHMSNTSSQMLVLQLEIYKHGACVTSYKTPSYDVFFLRPDAVLDGSKPISGGVPFCFPQFGPGKMQLHGFARNLSWTCLDVREESAGGSRAFSFLCDLSRAVYELSDTSYTREMWPHKFTARYQVDLTAGTLSLDFRVINKGQRDFSFATALHTYYAVRDINSIEIRGNFKGKKYLDRVSGETKTEDRDVLTIKSFTDRCERHIWKTMYDDFFCTPRGLLSGQEYLGKRSKNLTLWHLKCLLIVTTPTCDPRGKRKKRCALSGSVLAKYVDGVS
jgi:D-hexose-6-phosphate mutarotase